LTNLLRKTIVDLLRTDRTMMCTVWFHGFTLVTESYFCQYRQRTWQSHKAS